MRDTRNPLALAILVRTILLIGGGSAVFTQERPEVNGEIRTLSGRIRWVKANGRAWVNVWKRMASRMLNKETAAVLVGRILVVTAFLLTGAFGQQSGGAITGAPGTENLTGEIRWKISWGLPAADPTARTPLSNICEPFSVSVLEGGSVVSTDAELTPGRADGAYYRCKYKLFAPRGRPVTVRPAISGNFATSPWFNGQKLAAAQAGGYVRLPIGSSVYVPASSAESRAFDRDEKVVTLGRSSPHGWHLS